MPLRILLPHANSLKEKRHIARWNDAQIAVVLVSNDDVAALRVMNHIRDFAENDGRFDVAQVSYE